MLEEKSTRELVRDFIMSTPGFKGLITQVEPVRRALFEKKGYTFDENGRCVVPNNYTEAHWNDMKTFVGDIYTTHGETARRTFEAQARYYGEMSSIDFGGTVFEDLSFDRIENISSITSNVLPWNEKSGSSNIVLSVATEDILLGSDWATFSSCFRSHGRFTGRVYASISNCCIVLREKGEHATGMPKKVGRSWGFIHPDTGEIGLSMEYGTLKFSLMSLMEAVGRPIFAYTLTGSHNGREYGFNETNYLVRFPPKSLFVNHPTKPIEPRKAWKKGVSVGVWDNDPVWGRRMTSFSERDFYHPLHEFLSSSTRRRSA